MRKTIAIPVLIIVMSTQTALIANAIEVMYKEKEESFTHSLNVEKIDYTSPVPDFIESPVIDFRAKAMNKRIKNLSKHVDKTWYVFSGITPDGWDCSGLVMWFYQGFGLELYHSVTAQMHSGEITDEPIPGDIIAFSYHGSERGYHNGIYIGNDQFIHSPKPGKRTAVASVSKYLGEHSVAVYTRIKIDVLE
jgi:hypothetical protein